MLKWLWLAVVVVVLDQYTKVLASSELQYAIPVYVMPSINWFLAHNTGAAFSFLSDAGGWQRWFFIVLALVISGVIVVWLKGLPRDNKLLAVALVFILGGAIGNVIDRSLYGYVVDFIQFYYNAESCLPGFYATGSQCNWPAFNIADMAIIGGALLMVIDALFGKHDETDKA